MIQNLIKNLLAFLKLKIQNLRIFISFKFKKKKKGNLIFYTKY